MVDVSKPKMVSGATINKEKTPPKAPLDGLSSICLTSFASLAPSHHYTLLQKRHSNSRLHVRGVRHEAQSKRDYSETLRMNL